MARIARLIITSLLLLGRVFGQATASDPASSPITTDRPAVTDSSIVVPSGSLQAENGLADTVMYGQRTIDGSETLLRFGVASVTELRLTIPDYLGKTGVSSGFGDPAMGMKQQLAAAPAGFNLSLVLSLSLPAGAKAISSHGYDPSVQLPWSRALSANWTVAGMLSVYWPTQDGRRNTTGETTLLIDRQLTRTWDAFVEYAGDFPQAGGPRHLLHLGTAFKPTPHQQLDLHFGMGQSAAAADHFIGIGYSFRFQVRQR
jgi:hypothetical protein